jgi:hypothetical protein
MNMQTIEYLRLIGLTECLLGVLLVVLIFMVQKMWKRIEDMSVILLTIIPEQRIKAKLAELARKAEEARRGGAEHEKRAD